MTDKQPTQATSSTKNPSRDGVSDRPDKDGGVSASGSKGESNGGAYPNPHTGKKGGTGAGGGFMGHGGQTEQAYSGTGQRGADVDDDVDNANAPSREP